MAYDGNKLSLLVGTREGGFNVWLYKSADAIATVRALNYISDAQARGMQVGDWVFVKDTVTPTDQICIAVAVIAAGADLTDGTSISQTNT